MEKDLLQTFHNSSYRESVINEIIRIEPKFKEAAEWRKKDLEKKGLLQFTAV
jgi:hypothetical protein